LCAPASARGAAGLFGTYSGLWHVYDNGVSAMSCCEKESLFRSNAEKFYRV
jgi:hypothetical protein